MTKEAALIERRNSIEIALQRLREEEPEAYYFVIIKHLDAMLINFGLTPHERAELMLAIATKCAERRGMALPMRTEAGSAPERPE